MHGDCMGDVLGYTTSPNGLLFNKYKNIYIYIYIYMCGDMHGDCMGDVLGILDTQRVTL